MKPWEKYQKAHEMDEGTPAAAGPWTKYQDQAAKAAPAQESSLAEMIETGGRSALEGMTLGLSEPVVSGLSAAVGNAVDSGFESEGLGDFVSKATDTERLKKAYQADVERRRRLEAENPAIAAGSEVAGAVLPALLTGGASAPASAARAGASVVKSGTAIANTLAKGTQAAVKAIPMADKALAARGVVGGAARVAEKALEGAAVAGGSEAIKRGVERSTGFITEEDHLPGMGSVAALGAKIGGAMRAVPEAANLAKSAGRSVLAAFGGVKPETISKYLDKAPQVRDAKSIPDAKEIVDDAVARIQEGARGQRADLADSLVTQVGKLKEKVVQGSEDAYAILDRASKRNPSGSIRKGTEKIPTASLKGQITAEANALKVGGVAIGPSAKKAIAALDELRTDIGGLPKEITLSEAKQILQRLDKSISYVRNAGEFGDDASNALKSVRQTLDSWVKKKVPDYAAKMQEVASDAQLLDELASKYGEHDTAFRQVDRLLSAKNVPEAELLGRFEQATGANFQNKMAAIRQTAPVERMNPGMTESFIKSVMNGNSIENRKKLELLSKLTDQDLVAMVDNAGVAEAFTREFRAGSQHVNVWALLGGGVVGGLTGDSMGGGAGAMTGAVIGAMTTKFGPTVTRKILDGISRMQGAPSVQKIDRYIQGVPEAVKQSLKNDLVRAMTMPAGEPTGPVFVPDAERPALRRDLQSTRSLSPGEKARALDSLNRDGEVPEEVLVKISIGVKR